MNMKNITNHPLRVLNKHDKPVVVMPGETVELKYSIPGFQEIQEFTPEPTMKKEKKRKEKPIEEKNTGDKK